MQTADVVLALATILEQLGRLDEAVAEAGRTAALYARKGMEASAACAEVFASSLR